ncbi:MULTISPECIES: DUF1127 domain-containing protein [unclassified Ruegeria]|uniref:DUF1127 domain-containing protein n=1 Tax=unclassified Ruegeria TaxID=2625375 RepID=UPI00149232C0|nr:MULTISPECIES: DUF1127 domain-containing protein [unclassified Ruegeria]NOC43968.1 DUF1127 domain-containing protein [Ruegeria sp. HKCCD7559]NOD82698.1 DUF1127 domain-containing protein [Ruegeria sp. HKCCD6119]
MTQLAIHNPCKPAKRSLVSLISQAFELSRQRRKLAQLDAAVLDDIGVTREEASAEAKRFFWDAPQFWKR